MNITLDELKIVEFALSNIHRAAPVDPDAMPMFLLTRGKIRAMLKAALEAASAVPAEAPAPAPEPTDNGGGA